MKLCGTHILKGAKPAEDHFPSAGLNGGCRIGEATFAGHSCHQRTAEQPAVPLLRVGVTDRKNSE